MARHGRVGRAGAVVGVFALGVAAALAGGGAAVAATGPGVITTVAGGPGGPALGTKVALSSSYEGGSACGVSFAGGLTYIADSAAIRTLNPSTGWLETPVGTGANRPYSNAVPAASANLYEACSTVADAAGNLLFSDAGTDTIRVLAEGSGTFYGQAMTEGDVYTIAGDGTQGYSGDGGPATSAELNAPWDVVLDHAGNVVLGDAGNGRIRVVAGSTGTFYGQAMTAGHIYTVAGGGRRKTFGLPATSAFLDAPSGVAVDAKGNLVIGDGTDRVDVVARTSGTFYGQKMTADHIYSVAGNGTPGYSGDGGPATAAKLDEPSTVIVDSAGNLLIDDAGNSRIRVVAQSTATFYGHAMTAGDIYTIAGDGHCGFSGDGGLATAAELYEPGGMGLDGNGNLVIADTDNDRVRVVAEETGTFYGQAMTTGDIYTVAGLVPPGPTSPESPYGYSGDGGPALRAQFSSPQGVADGPGGSTLLADSYNGRIRMVAGAAGTFYAQSMKAGDVYTIAGDGLGRYTGDGGLATKAELSLVSGVASDAAGNLVFADYQNARVRVVANATGTYYGQKMTAGHIYTVAGGGTGSTLGNGGPAVKASLSGPKGVAVDGHGNLLITDVGDNEVRVVAASAGTFYGQSMKAGDIYDVAGNGKDSFSGNGVLATSAALGHPAYVATDSAGDLFVSFDQAQRIRMIPAASGTYFGTAMRARHEYTIAGTATAGYNGDGRPGTRAELDVPTSMAVDGQGNLVVDDDFNNRVRVLAATDGTYYGQTMTTGDIYTITGNGSYGYSGNGGVPTAAAVVPTGIALTPAGDLLIADGLGFVREVMFS